jgi:hypothetical protein
MTGHKCCSSLSTGTLIVSFIYPLSIYYAHTLCSLLGTEQNLEQIWSLTLVELRVWWERTDIELSIPSLL